MAIPIESVLSQSQKDSVTIKDFIFHIIDPDAEVELDKVIYLDEVQLEAAQKEFFLDRLRDIAEGTQYVFKEDAVHLSEKCKALSDEPENFNLISRQISEDFAGRHDGQMSAGVFVVAVVEYTAKVGEKKKLILLVKMDKRPTFSYSHKNVGGRLVAKMQNVPNALNETKQAIQKSAVVDPSGHFAWNVLAFDRSKKPLLSDYFRAFLGVIERQEDSSLTRTAFASVKQWANGLSTEDMPEGEDAFGYRGRALNYLRDNDSFDTGDFIKAVVKDENPERKEKLSRELKDALDAAGVAGQRFTPKPESLPKGMRKQVYETLEGVTISFDGAKDAAGVKVESGPEETVITIRSRKVTLKA